MTRAMGKPVLIGAAEGTSPLQRAYLGSGLFSEDWLQSLIHNHPEMLPVADIEPGFGTLVPVAREVPCGHGYIDNLYVTPSGDIVLVETKLWRNNEIRREVVAQALDYVSALTAMSFAEFERAVAKGQGAPRRLFDLVAEQPDRLEEAAFIDAVANNLRRGRMLVMVLGDGIRSETELLSGLLQSHAGAHFTFALVELATWQTPDGTLLVVPSTLAKTVMIERGVVRIEQAGVRIEPVPQEAGPAAQSLSMSDFMQSMAQRDPALPKAIYGFIDTVEPLGIYPELKATLSFKADLPNLARPINLGYITKDGKFWTDTLIGKVPEAIALPYLEAVAALAGGAVTQARSRFAAGTKGTAPAIADLLPAHQEALAAAMGVAIHALREADG